MAGNALIRLGDLGSHGGGMAEASSIDFLVQGLPVCVDGDMYDCTLHGYQPITATGKTTSGGKKLAVDGDQAACGAVITGTGTTWGEP